MPLIRYQDLAAPSTSLSLDTTRAMGSRTFFDIMANTDVPQDPDHTRVAGYTRQQFERSDAGDAAIAKFMTIAARTPVIYLTDLDGTGSRFSSTVAESELAPGYLDSLISLNDRSIAPSSNPDAYSQAYAITGRSEEDARALLSKNNRLQIPVIYSHGTGLVMPEGGRENIALSPAEEDFLNSAFRLAHDIGHAHPDLQVQIKQSGIDVKDVRGQVIPDIRTSFERLVAISPVRDGKSVFAVHNEGELETSIRYDAVDKAKAIETFVLSKLQNHPGALLVFAADSFDKGGTDRKAGQFVQDQGGIVIQVMNDRANISSDGFKPDIVLPNPEALATLMGHISRHKEAMAGQTRAIPLQPPHA